MKRVLMSLAALSATVLVPSMASAQDSVELTLVHGLPGITAEVAVDGTIVIDNFAPGSLANITSFAGQTLTNVTLTDTASGDVVIGPIASLEMPSAGNHSLVAHLDASGTAVLNSYENNTAAASSGDSRITLRHTAAAGPIDLLIGTDRVIVGVSSGESGETEVPSGPITNAQVSETGDPGFADVPTLTNDADTNTIVYVVGSDAEGTLDFVVQIVAIASSAATTTTTDPNATTTTTDPNATTTSTTSTSTTSTTSTSVVPTAVNTGSPLDGNSNTFLITIALGGLALAGGAMYARRRV